MWLQRNRWSYLCMYFSDTGGSKSVTGVTQGLHLDQKLLKLLHRKPSHVGSQFDQCFVLSGASKATHVDDFQEKNF